MSTSTSEEINITHLPPCVLLNIFKYLSHEDLLSVQNISKIWYQLAFHGSLWKTLDTREFGEKFVMNGSFLNLFREVMSFVECLHFDIRLFKINNISDKDILCPKLQQIHLYDEYRYNYRHSITSNSKCRFVIDADFCLEVKQELVKVSQKYPDVKGLFFHEFSVNIGAFFENLEEFYCGEDMILDDQHFFPIKQFVNSHQSLKHVHIADFIDNGSTDFIVSLMCDLPNIETIDIQNWGGDVDKVCLDLQNKKLALNNLKKLTLEGIPDLVDEFFNLFVQSAPNLQYLDLTFYDGKVTDRSLKLIAVNCPQLETLIIRDSTYYLEDLSDYFTEEGFKFIIMHCSKLKEIKLDGVCNKSVTDAVLQMLARSCLQLTVLEIGSNEFISDTTVMLIVENCQNLRHLDISGCVKLTKASLTYILLHCKQLEFLKFAGYPTVSDFDLPHRQEFRNPQQGSQELSLEPAVKRQKLSSELQEEVGSEILNGLKVISDSCLKELNLMGCASITDACVLNLVQFYPFIQCLNLCSCDSITDNAVKVVITNCRYLKCLNISHSNTSNSEQNTNGVTKLTNQCLFDIANFGNFIEKLEITDNKNITAKGLLLVILNCPLIKMIKVTILLHYNKFRSKSRIKINQLRKMIRKVKDKTIFYRHLHFETEIKIFTNNIVRSKRDNPFLHRHTFM